MERRDLWLSAASTTNNQMALAGADAVLRALAGKDKRLRVLLISDSEYLVRGVREWMPRWIARGWRRAGGVIENLERWKSLAAALDKHDVQLTWVRGHQGHPKNEYANDLAVLAARQQTASEGIAESGFAAWLQAQRGKGQYASYDVDAAFQQLEAKVAAGTPIPIRGAA
jgi:ribonuclease HI